MMLRMRIKTKENLRCGHEVAKEGRGEGRGSGSGGSDEDAVEGGGRGSRKERSGDSPDVADEYCGAF